MRDLIIGATENVIIISKRPEDIFFTSNDLKKAESISSMENIMILIFDKPSRRGADNRCQVPVMGTKT